MLHEASHVEIYFRDQYITRSDMWRLTASLLADTCPYNAEKLLFLGSIRATVGNVWVRGEKVRSAYFSPRTVPIFRSESARYTIFIQMSREMWQFDTDDGGEGDGAGSGDPMAGGAGGVGGEIVFNKLINGFLPELFKRWRRINSHHLVSIVLFTRIVYEHGEPVGVLGGSAHECDEFLGTPGGIEIGEGRRYRDFFRVVISSMGSADWTVILHRLKREFSTFQRDVLVQPAPEDDSFEPLDLTPSASSAASMASRPNSPAITAVDKLRPRSSSTNHTSPRIRPAKEPPPPRKTIITGRPSAAMHGNILEAINLGTLQFSRDYIDRDLVRTGISIIIVTPGTGHFEVDYEMLKATTDGLIANGMGVDLVCLSKVPLHKVPLFRYRNPIVTSSIGKDHDEPSRPGLSPPKNQHPQPEPGEWVYAVPHWIDISFWSSASEKKTRSLKGPNNKGKKKDPKAPARKSLGFRARCKMYELQMMGIIENEISCISIPFLHENPLWRPLPAETYVYNHAAASKNDIDGKETERKRREAYKEQFAWMEEYDDLAFRPLTQLKEGLLEAEKRRDGGEAEAKKIEKVLQEDDPILGTSYHGDSSRRRGTTAYFDRKMRERRPELESPRDGNSPSTATVGNSGGLLGRPARLARQLSFGFKSWGLTKATPKVAPSGEAVSGTMTSGVGPGGVMVTRGFDTGDLGSPRSPLSPRGTIRDLSRELGKVEEIPEKSEKPEHSRPISIASKTSKNTAASSLEATQREKDWRRSFVGSLGSTPLDARSSVAQSRDLLKAASTIGRPAALRSDLVANADKTVAIPPTVSPTSALAPWVQLLNPSNPKKDPPTVVSQFRRWHHVFPRPVRTGTVKWKSLCSPAALPLTTEHFPTPEQLANEYQEHTYVISQNEDYSNREELVRAMIALRLAQGFQIVVGSQVAESWVGRGRDTGIFDKSYMVQAGSSCFMSRGTQIHQLICDEEYNIEVKRYVRKPTTAITTIHLSHPSGRPDEYTSFIKTIMNNSYIPVRSTFRQPGFEYNWNYADQYIGGYEDTLTESLRYWRARFVLIPNDPPESARRGQGAYPTELNDEEIRLEGIRRLTMLFQRNRYIPPEERHFEKYGRRKDKEKNPLQIIYKTVDPSVAVAQELETLSTPDSDGQMRRSQLLTTEMFDAKDLDIKLIAAELQSPRGVRLQDRRWHLKLHTNCFISEEMVTWIVENFKNVETRSDAEAVGLKLFKAGLFQHVDKRHEFRDGNYFFRIAEAYALPTRPTSSWFGSFNKGQQPPIPPLPQTPYSQGQPQYQPTTPDSPLQRSRSMSSATTATTSALTDFGADSDDTALRAITTMTPTAVAAPPKKKVEVELSKAMRYNVDPGERSYRPEVVTLHYDRLHNPDNCYHLRLEWMNTTSKLIEDCLTSWARTVDRYGLKLVEAPIDEVSQIPKLNLFRAPLIVRPALQPADVPGLGTAASAAAAAAAAADKDDSGIPTPITPAQGSDDFYHVALLRKFGFVLDTESASRFPADVRVRYSWGTPCFTHSQYIHRSGVIFAQVTPNPPPPPASASSPLNTTATTATTTSAFSSHTHTPVDSNTPTQTTAAAALASATFLLMANRAYTLRVGSIHHRNLPATPAATPEAVADSLAEFCADEDRLRSCWEEAARATGRWVGREREREREGRWGSTDPPWYASSPVLQPVAWGSPTVKASDVKVAGRTVSVGGRSAGSGSIGPAGGTGNGGGGVGVLAAAATAAAARDVDEELSLGGSSLALGR